MSNVLKKIVILGGGFGGVYAAMELQKHIRDLRHCTVTLVSDHNFFLFTPLLHEVVSSNIDPMHIVNPIPKFLRHITSYTGTVEQIYLPRKQIFVRNGAGHSNELTFDFLVIALGSIANFHGISGLEKNALTMKSLGDAFYLRNMLIERLEQAHFERQENERQRQLTFVVAGGGLAGVETVGAVNDFVREAIRYYPNLPQNLIKVVLVHSENSILSELGEPLGCYALEKLRERHIEVRLHTRVVGASAEEVQLDDGTTIPACTIVWTAGVSPNDLLEKLPVQRDHGRIVVNEFLEVPDWPGIYAVGDCAAIPNPDTGKSQPPTAQHALREGRLAAQNIMAALTNGTKQSFAYRDIGRLASLGKRTAVANIWGYNFSGFFAWWIWRTLYWLKLPRFEKKLRVAIDWTLDLIFSRELAQVLTSRAPTLSHGRHLTPKSSSSLSEKNTP